MITHCEKTWSLYWMTAHSIMLLFYSNTSEEVCILEIPCLPCQFNLIISWILWLEFSFILIPQSHWLEKYWKENTHWINSKKCFAPLQIKADSHCKLSSNFSSTSVKIWTKLVTLQWHKLIYVDVAQSWLYFLRPIHK